MPVAAPDVIRPAFWSTPAIAAGNLGDEVAELAVALGQDVGPEERIALAALTPVKADGMPAGLEAGIVCGRQNVKSWALEMCTIHDAWVTKVGRCLWSAHQTKTSDDNFEHLTGLVENFDWLRRRVRRVYSGNGNHKIVFLDGRTIEFGARENGPTGRGRVKVNRLTLDEWLYGTARMLGAFVPTMGSAGDRYIRFGSSPGALHSEALRTLRARGRRGGDPSLSWVEWTSEREADGKRVLPSCADPGCLHLPGVAVGCYLDDQDVIRANNPAYDRRLSVEFVLQERLALSPVEYARERAGIWEDPPTSDTADDVLAGWADARSVREPSGALHLGVAVSHDSRSAALVVCGAGVLEVVDYRKGQGTGWIAARVAEARQRWAFASVGLLAGSAAAPLGRPGPDGAAAAIPDCVEVSASDERVASLALVQGLGSTYVHRDQPPLNIAAAGAVRAFAGDGWRWSSRASGADISPLKAAVIAVHLSGDQASYDPLANFMPNLSEGDPE